MISTLMWALSVQAHLFIFFLKLSTSIYRPPTISRPYYRRQQHSGENLRQVPVLGQLTSCQVGNRQTNKQDTVYEKIASDSEKFDGENEAALCEVLQCRKGTASFPWDVKKSSLKGNDCLGPEWPDCRPVEERGLGEGNHQGQGSAAGLSWTR